MNFTKLIATLLFISVLGNLASTSVEAQSFTTIRTVKVTPLSNGVQVDIEADGILQYREANTTGQKMSLLFAAARNATGKNFYNVNSYPLSYIQLSTPQDSVDGIGVLFQISNFINTTASITKTADGQGVLITIQSDRTIEKSTPGASDLKSVTQSAAAFSDQISYDGHLLTIRTLKADIHSVLSGIAEKAGISVAVDDSVDRLVSLNLVNVEPSSAIQSIATAYGLALSKIDDIYMISEGVPTDLASYHLSATQSFRMQNTQAQTASGLLPNFLYSYVKVNSEQNAVVVTAPSQMLAKISEDLTKVDVPSPQILIEAIAVEFTDTKNLNLGLQLGDVGDHGQFGLDSPSGAITYNTIGKLPANFEATLSALELQGKARVRARPQMAAVNGRTANIFIGTQRFIQTQSNNFGQTQTRIQPVDVGVKLAVTPLTGGNGEITCEISPEVSNITELDLLTGLPVLSTRRADTTVRVNDGETVVIGGLTLDQDQRHNSKVPILGDLPLIGNLFRSTTRSTVHTELVIFVTPHIMASTAAPVPVATTTEDSQLASRNQAGK